MADAIEVGAADGKGGKGEEPGLIISLVRRKFPLAFIRAFCRLKVSEIYRDIIYYIISLFHHLGVINTVIRFWVPTPAIGFYPFDSLFGPAIVFWISFK